VGDAAQRTKGVGAVFVEELMKWRTRHDSNV
jgi:hypothetical protein